MQVRLIGVLISDADRSQRLMISNEPANTNHEATLFFDGSAQPNPGAGGCGWVLKDHRGNVISQGGRECDIDSHRRTTSNQAEYQGLIDGLEGSIAAGVRRLEVRGDSELIIKQMTGDYQCKSPNLIELYREAKGLASRFQTISFKYIPRDENSHADSIARHHAQKLQASWRYN
jgi:ribonuclease HI